MIEHIIHNGETISIIIRKSYSKEGVEFFTPDHFSQQVGYMKRRKGHIIKSHVHYVASRNVTLTQEVLFIKTGKVRIDFYEYDRNYIESRILNSGDFILLANGGHGFEMLEETEIIEIKQGPYIVERDKIKIETISPKKIIMKDNRD